MQRDRRGRLTRRKVHPPVNHTAGIAQEVKAGVFGESGRAQQLIIHPQTIRRVAGAAERENRRIARIGLVHRAIRGRQADDRGGIGNCRLARGRVLIQPISAILVERHLHRGGPQRQMIVDAMERDGDGLLPGREIHIAIVHAGVAGEIVIAGELRQGRGASQRVIDPQAIRRPRAAADGKDRGVIRIAFIHGRIGHRQRHQRLANAARDDITVRRAVIDGQRSRPQHRAGTAAGVGISDRTQKCLVTRQRGAAGHNDGIVDHLHRDAGDRCNPENVFPRDITVQGKTGAYERGGAAIRDDQIGEKRHRIMISPIAHTRGTGRQHRPVSSIGRDV